MKKKELFFKEIEFKYSTDLHTGEFISRCHRYKLNHVMGIDHFYGNKRRVRSFLRHRISNSLNQLTYKKKISKDNNFIRIENNLSLGEDSTRHAVAHLCAQLDYEYNTSILKSVWFCETPTYTLSFYRCYRGDNLDSIEIGRFIEIEMSETYPWKNCKQAYSELVKLEKKFKFLGINSKSRVKKSLWEMYKK